MGWEEMGMGMGKERVREGRCRLDRRDGGLEL